MVHSTAASASASGASAPQLTAAFLPFFSIDRLCPEVDVETAEEAERRLQSGGGAQHSEHSTDMTSTPTAAPPPTATGVVAAEEEAAESWEDEADVVSAAPTAASKAPSTAAGGQWDDEDVEAGEEALDDWEAQAEDGADGGSKSTQTAAKAKTKPSRASAASASVGSPLLPPVAAIAHPLVDALCPSVHSALSQAHSLQAEEPPPLPPSSLPSPPFDVRFLGEEIKEEGDILKDKSGPHSPTLRTHTVAHYHRSTCSALSHPPFSLRPPLLVPLCRKAMRAHQRQINFMTKYSKSLGGGKVVQREVIVKEKKGGGAVEGDKEKENTAASRSGGAKGGKAGGGGGLGGKKGGGGGAKGKGSIADQIKAEGLARQKAKEVEKISRSIAFAAALRDLPGRIESLDAASEAYSDEVVVPALLQLLDWQMQWWREQKAEQSAGHMTEAVKVWTLVQDVYRRFKPHLRLQDLQTLQRTLIQLGFDDIARRLVADYQLSMTSGTAVAGEKEITVDPKTVKAVKEHSVGMSSARFQMEFGGPFMLRNVASAADDRVDFYRQTHGLTQP